MNIREIRSKVNEFFLSRKLPAPDKLSDDSAQAIYERMVAGRATGVRSFTRNAQLRAVNGAESVAPATPVTAPVAEDNDAMREALHQQAMNLLRENGR